MKKLSIIFFLAVIYSFTVTASVFQNVVAESKQEVMFIAEDDKNRADEDVKKDKKKIKTTTVTAPGCCPAKQAVKPACSESQIKSCADSKVNCPKENKKKEKK